LQITLAEAVELSREQGVTVGEIEALGFEILSTAGAANVAAANAVPVNAELLAHAEALYTGGRKAKNTQSGRSKRVLGDQDGISPYRVIVTKA